jgi:hypothetical protein
VPSDECWGKGRARGGGLSTRLDGGGVNIMAALEKRVKYCRTMFGVTHDFLLKLHPGQKLGDAVARASVVLVRLLRPIHHEGINTLRIIAALEGDGGGSLLQYWHLGDLGAPPGRLAKLLKAREEGPKNNFLEETARSQNRLWQKKGLALFN